MARAWCRTDPVVQFYRNQNGVTRKISVTLETDLGLQNAAVSPLAFTFKYPAGGGGDSTTPSVVSTDDGLGEGEDVTFESAQNLDWVSGRCQTRTIITDLGLGDLDATYTNSENVTEEKGDAPGRLIIVDISNGWVQDADVTDAGNGKVVQVAHIRDLVNKVIKFGISGP